MSNDNSNTNDNNDIKDDDHVREEYDGSTTSNWDPAMVDNDEGDSQGDLQDSVEDELGPSIKKRKLSKNKSKNNEKQQKPKKNLINWDEKAQPFVSDLKWLWTMNV